MYTKEGFADVLHRDGFTGSWLEWLLRETETSHGARLFSLATVLCLVVDALAPTQPRSAATTGACPRSRRLDLLDSLAPSLYPDSTDSSLAHPLHSRQPRRAPLHPALRAPPPDPPRAQLPPAPRRPHRDQRQPADPLVLPRVDRALDHAHRDRPARQGQRRRQLWQRRHARHRVPPGHLAPDPLRCASRFFFPDSASPSGR